MPALASVLQPLIDVLEAILKVFHDDIGMSWGLAIIALTVFIRALLLPLTLKQLHTMDRIAQASPRIKQLRVEHGSDPQRLQRETLAFYRENKLNPLGGFLPAVAQVPVFLSLYSVLRTDLRQDICPAINPPGALDPQPCGETAASHFLFIPDLTSQATGAVLIALIGLYIGSQLASFLMSANPRTDKTQQGISIALPFLFIAIAWQLPAGLLLYWITANAWTTGQGAIVRKRLGSLRQAAQATAGGAGRLGELRTEIHADPPPSGRRPGRSGDSTTKPGAPPPQEEALGSAPVTVPMKRVMEWANVVFTAVSGVGNPRAQETLAGALARLIRRRRNGQATASDERDAPA